MVDSILSPCLYLKDNELKNLGELIETLEFIDNYLEINFGITNLSILHENNWYSLPKYKSTVYNQFTTLVVPLLKKLSKKVNIIQVTDPNINYSISQKTYLITDCEEFNYLLNFIKHSPNNCILFVGSANKNVDDTLDIVVNSKTFNIPVVKNVWFDESGHFDSLILESVKNYNNVFPCKELCCKIGNTILEIGNKSLFKKYAKIIAKRNGYYKLPYSSRQYKNVPYYMRNDKEYIICVDTLHGLFEVFQKTGSTYENYKGEYDFSCNEVSGKTSSSETHICYKSY